MTRKRKTSQAYTPEGTPWLPRPGMSDGYQLLNAYVVYLLRNEEFGREVTAIYAQQRGKQARARAVIALCEKYGLFPADWERTIRSFFEAKARRSPARKGKGKGVLLPTYTFATAQPGSGFGELCKISDLSHKDLGPIEVSVKEERNKHFPIAIQVSPYASVEVIRDFLSQFKTQVEDALSAHRDRRVRLGQKRSRSLKGGRLEIIFFIGDLHANGKTIDEIHDAVVTKFKKDLTSTQIQDAIHMDVRLTKESPLSDPPRADTKRK